MARFDSCAVFLNVLAAIVGLVGYTDKNAQSKTR